MSTPKPTFDLVSKLIDLLVGAGIDRIKNKAQRSAKIIGILNQLGINPNTPLADDFDGVYAYALAEYYENDISNAVLEFFGDPIIKTAFRKSFEQRTFDVLEDETENFLDWNKVGEKFKKLDIQPQVIFPAFKEKFYQAISLTRRPLDVVHEHQADDLLDAIQELPKKDDLKIELLPIKKNLEKITEKDERLDTYRLKAIANESLGRHRAWFSFYKDEKKAREIPREVHKTVIDSLLQSPKIIIGIMGPSGIGKSTLLRQIGRDINNNQGIALWISPEDILLATSIDELLRNSLYRYDASLNNDVSFDVLEIASRTNMGLILLVDDVNRASRPDQILSSISALANNSATKDTTIHFVVPLWNGQVAPTPDTRESEKLWEIINLGYFSDTERKEYSQLFSPTKYSSVQQLITSLGGDPFLVGLASDELEKISNKEPLDLLREIFNYTIDEAIKKAREASKELATEKEFSNAIDSLIELMLITEAPEPRWETIKEQLGIENAKLILALAKVNRLGWIDVFNDNEIWRWKHTRLRDVIIGRWLAKKVLLTLDINSTNNNSFLNDPGLAESFALALVFLPEQAQEKALVALCKYQVLSLIEILQLNLFSQDSKLGAMIAQALNRVLASYDGKTREFVDTPQSVILFKLSWITNPLILDITNGLPKNWSWSVARLRNGDLSSGMLAVANHAQSHEFLMGRFPFLEQAIIDFGQINIDRKMEIVKSLATDLTNPQRLNAVFYIASVLKWSELIESLWDAWVNLRQESKLQSLAGMVWFLCGYDSTSIVSKLEMALIMSLEINNVPKSEGMGSERLHSFTDPLRLALSKPISPTAARVWAKTISENQELSNSIGYLLGGIDHPETLDVYVHLERKWFGVWHETSESMDPMSGGLREDNRVKREETRNRLWEITLQDNDLATRRRALGFFGKTATSQDLLKLQSIQLDDPIFENILRLRLRLRDGTASSVLIENINKDPNEWLRFASMVPYEPGVFDAVIANLEKIPPEHGFYMTDSIFYRLPKEQVKQIVLTKEKLLLNSHETWSSLWLSNEDSALKFVAKAVKQVKPEEADKLEHFFSMHSMPPPSPITQKMLDALVPVLNCFPSDSLKWLADIALRSGFGKWAIDNLEKVLKDVKWRAFEWVFIENIIATLSEAAQNVDKGFDVVVKNSNLYALEYSFRDKYEYMANPVDAVNIWLKDSFNANNFTISARIISKFGSANDIDWWLSQKPNDEKLISVWELTLYHLKRRRWQNSEA